MYPLLPLPSLTPLGQATILLCFVYCSCLLTLFLLLSLCL